MNNIMWGGNYMYSPYDWRRDAKALTHGFKYVARIRVGDEWRYFYDQDKYLAYLDNHKRLEKAKKDIDKNAPVRREPYYDAHFEDWDQVHRWNQANKDKKKYQKIERDYIRKYTGRGQNIVSGLLLKLYDSKKKNR